MSSKEALRREMARRRAALSPEESRSASERLCRLIGESEEYRRADGLFAYYPLRGETDILPLLEAALAEGKAVMLPRVSGKAMAFHRTPSLEKRRLVPNGWEIYEPDPALPVSGPGDFSRPLMLVPGTAFTREGKRLGRGGGYYDRYLGLNGGFFKAGTAYPFQIVPDLPSEPHDIVMDRMFY